MQKNRRVPFTVSLFGAFCITSSAFAHHGTVANGALYLTESLLEFEGEIVEVLWRNPHARARMSVIDPNGEEKVWELELGPTPRELENQDLYADDFLGRVRVAGYQSRRDPNEIGAMHILLPSGEELIRSRSAGPLWSDTRVPEGTENLDPSRVAEARRAANSIFRVWGPRLLSRPTAADFETQLTDRGRALLAQFNAVTDNPELECRTGVVPSMMDPNALEIVDEGDRIIIHAEEYNVRRTVYLDFEAGGVEPIPSTYGFSVGHWEDDVLTVTTTHMDYPLMLPDGVPHSDQVELFESFSISDDQTMLNYSVTVTDPVVFTEPVTIERQRRWNPGYEILDFDCVLSWIGEEGD